MPKCQRRARRMETREFEPDLRPFDHTDPRDTPRRWGIKISETKPNSGGIGKLENPPARRIPGSVRGGGQNRENEANSVGGRQWAVGSWEEK